MEDLAGRVGSVYQWFNNFIGLNFYSIGGKYVYTKCRKAFLDIIYIFISNCKLRIIVEAMCCF
jgi:hypothetical protein